MHKYLTSIIVVCLFFYSCKGQDEGVIIKHKDVLESKAKISFLNKMNDSTKIMVSIPQKASIINNYRSKLILEVLWFSKKGYPIFGEGQSFIARFDDTNKKFATIHNVYIDSKKEKELDFYAIYFLTISNYDFNTLYKKSSLYKKTERFDIYEIQDSSLTKRILYPKIVEKGFVYIDCYTEHKKDISPIKIPIEF